MKTKILDRYDTFFIGLGFGLIVMDLSNNDDTAALIKLGLVFVYIIFMWIIDKMFAYQEKAE